MEINAAEFIITARDILAADADVKAWCQEAFSKDPTVYAGIDEENPPTQSDYPIIAIVDVRSTAGTSANRRTFEMDIGFGLVQEAVTAEGQTKTYDGMLQVEHFRELGELALLRGLKNPYVHFTGAMEKLDLYPIFVSFTTFAIDEIASRRRPRFAS